jgi:hypothetical protein
MRRINISFQEKRVSRNAVITFVIGLITLAGYLILLLSAIFTGGHLPLLGGLIGCLLGVLALFGTLWGVISFDDVRTTQRFKIPGIVLNIISVFLAIAFFMVR